MANYRISTSDLREALVSLTRELGELPTESQMSEHGTYSASVYRDRFGSWTDALIAVDLIASRAELPPSRRRRIPIESLLTDLHSLTAALGETPTITELKEYGAYSPNCYMSRFGSWQDVVSAAGLPPVSYEKYTDEELLSVLRAIGEEKGRAPYAQEVTSETSFSHSTYQSRFGSWNAAVEAAGFDPNRVWGGQVVECCYCGAEFKKKYSHAERHEYHFCDDTCMGNWESEHYSGDGNPRWNGGYDGFYGSDWPEVREDVIERDDGCCQACGLTQEEHLKQHGQGLQVHHITPFRAFDSASEANQRSNLITFCTECHPKWEGIPVAPRVV